MLNFLFRPSSPQTHLVLESPNSKGESSTGQEDGRGLKSYLDEASAGAVTPGTITPDSPSSPTSTSFDVGEDTVAKLALAKSSSSVAGKVQGHHRSASEPPFLKDGQSGQLSEGYGSMTTQSTSSCSDAGRRYSISACNIFLDLRIFQRSHN